jgi:DNA mismatch repair protein PMS2
MIEVAEMNAAKPSVDNAKRAVSVMKGRMNRKDATLSLVQTLETSMERVEMGLKRLERALDAIALVKASASTTAEDGEKSAEERLSLTVAKSDFNSMRIIGQFNLGFILATRTSSTPNTPDELFIIDQHASDEKYNFERLQSQTIVQNQRLVHPKQLDLTAIEEEIILNHSSALEKNGFEISVDESGDAGVGQRCKLTSLPMSREVTFSLSDLEELLSLLAEQPEGGKEVVRPTKVRKMFAMRACRSSIMVGKTLSGKQMERVVRHMGELDKPWNCPHGRPTMRHLYSLDGWEEWEEGWGIADEVKEASVDWAAYVTNAKESGLLAEREEEESDEVMEEGEGENPAEWLFTQAIKRGKESM